MCVSQIIPQDRNRRDTSTLLLQKQADANPKFNKDAARKRATDQSLDGYRHKKSQQNTCKLNTGTYPKDHSS